MSAEVGGVAGVGRFAPSTTGPPHLGTLLAALLAWLDARSRGARFVLRLEDLDPERCRPAFADALVEGLGRLGLDWDECVRQSDRRAAHEAALDVLAAQNRLYPAPITRAELRAIGRPAADGGFAYDNRGRGAPLPPGGWREATDPLRVALPDGLVRLRDESGLDLSQDPSVALGDPIVRRRDGAIAYPLAVVVDDAASGVTRVVRGRDIAPSTATQVRLAELLGLPRPSYRHHFLLLERHGDKLAKSHGAPAAFASHHDAEVLTGHLAWLAGLTDTAAPTTPRALLAGFSWARVRGEDWVVGD